MNQPGFSLANLQRVITALLAFGLSSSVCVAATSIWSGGGGADTLWSSAANWTPVGPPTSSDAAVFNDTAAVSDQYTINNVVGAGTAVAGLSFTNASLWHVTQIPAGVTLTVSGTTIVGGLAPGSLTTSAAMTGEGTLLATGPMTLGNGSTSSGSQSPGNLDLSGLATFIYNAPSSTIGIGTTGSRSSGNLTLASTSNSITAGTININGATGTSSTPTFNLGTGTNNINVNSFNVGGGRSTTRLQFASGGGGLRLRGTGGTDSDRTTMVVGNRNTGGTAALTTTGNVFFNGHPVDLKFATLTLGQVSRNGTEANFRGVGVFQFDDGLLDATTINMGLCSGTSPSSGAIGTLTVGYAGRLQAGNISLANVSSGVTTSFARGTLEISGGTVIVSGNILKTTSTLSTGIVSVVSGSLTVGGTMGATSNPIDSLELTDATLTLRAGVAAPVAVTTLTTGGFTNVINISLMPSIVAYPAQYEVIKYTDAIGGIGYGNIGLGTLPEGSPSFAGYLSNNVANQSIDLVITSGPPPAQPIVWSGAQDGNWDASTKNWLFGGVPTNYNNAGDSVTFNDSGAISTINLVTPVLTPGSITVNNDTKAYTFAGAGKISGSTGLTKQGPGTLTIANSAVNDFVGEISAEGTLAFAQPVNATVANPISGAGTLVKNGGNTLTLSGVNSFAGGVTVNEGTLRSGNISALGSGAVTVNSGATLVMGANHTNAMILAGGTLGTSLSQNPAGASVTAAAGTTSTVYIADPQNLVTPADGFEMNFTNKWSGSGTVILATVFNDPSPDGGNGFRLRGTEASDFSGTLILSNRVKGELQTSVAGPFSPLGTGRIVMQGGVLTNNTLTGTYSELNLRNNSVESTVFGNDIEIAGTGIAVLDPLGSAPAGTAATMGNLKIGGGQELGINLNGSGPDHVVVFQSVTLMGGSPVFSPKTPGWNTTPQIGSDLTLNNIGESVASGLVMNGLRTLTLGGTCTYSGSTAVSNGTLVVAGALNGGGPVTVAFGTFTGDGSMAGNLTVLAEGVLAPGSGVGKFTVGGVVTLQGTNVMEIDLGAGTNDLLQAGASITYGGTLSIVQVSTPFQAGDSYKLFNAGSYLGAFSAIIPETPGDGLTWDTTALNTAGILKVRGQAEPTIDGILVNNGVMTVSGNGGVPNGQYRVLTSTDVAAPGASWTATATNAFTPAGGFSFDVPINSTEPERFFRIQAF